MKQPTPKLSISRDEICAIYAQGEDAVMALVESLGARTNALEARVEALEHQKSKDSPNSSKPPSGDGFGKRTKSLRTKSGRPSGGQTDHPGSTLEWREEVDQIITHSVVNCSGCGASLKTVEVVSLNCRQVHDLPPLQLVVSEHQSEEKCCPECGVLNQGRFPADVNSVVQYGCELKGLMVYFMEGQFLPSERVCQLLGEVLDCEISEATLYNARLRCYEQLATVEVHIKSGVQAAPVVHFDETGLRVKGQLMWLHVACNGWLTAYFIHPKRGQVAMDAMDILPNFTGVSVHDGLASYAQYDSTHALCNAHHLRELRFIVERYQQDWANQMTTLLIDIKTQVEIAKDTGQTTLSLRQRADFEQRCQRLIASGLKANPTPAINPEQPKRKGRFKQSPPKKLLDRLNRHQAAV